MLSHDLPAFSSAGSSVWASVGCGSDPLWSAGSEYSAPIAWSLRGGHPTRVTSAARPGEVPGSDPVHGVPKGNPYAERAVLLERAEPHVAGPMRTSFVTGLETWFTLPGQPGAAAPPPYKTALVTWITIFPLITAIVALTGPLLKDLPLAARLGITTALAVPLMTWVVMPRATRLLRAWLYPDA